MMKRPWMGMMAMAVMAAPPLASQTLTGRVLDSATGQPIAAAEVSAVAEGSRRATVRTESDADGRFTLTMRSAGTYRLRATRLGYTYLASPLIQLGAGETFTYDLNLRPASVQLDSVVVSTRVTPPFRDARARDFYRRAERGWGRYVMPEVIDARRPATTMTLLRGVRGLRINSMHQGIPLMRGRKRLGGFELCAPTVYINGIRRVVYQSLDDVVDPDELWAIEVYGTAEEAPGELPPFDPNCGVIAIWTRQA